MTSSLQRHRRRSAFTLIEMVAMLTLLTAASAASLSLLSNLVKITGKTTKQSVTIHEVERLAEQLRAEAHRSQVAHVESDGMKVTFEGRDGLHCEFSLQDDGVTYRSVDRGVVRHDRFRIEPHADWQFSQSADDGLVSLRLRPTSGEREEWRIDAALDREEEISP